MIGNTSKLNPHFLFPINLRITIKECLLILEKKILKLNFNKKIYLWINL